MKSLILIMLSIACLLCGCKSPELVAYKTLSSIALSVNVAKHAYEDYRAGGFVTPEQDMQVKRVYIQYQAAMKVAEVYERDVKRTGDKFSFNTALSAVSASSSDFINFIATIVPSFKPIVTH